MRALYASGGSLGRNIVAGLWTLTYVMCDEFVWNCRYNPTFTRFYN